MIQRSFSELLPSEKGEVLTERYEKVVCQGKRNDILQEIARLEGKEISCGHGVHKKTRDSIGEEYGMVGRNAARYLRVHFLNDDLKLMLDTGRLTLVAGVEISFLNEEEQNLVYRVLQTDGIKADLDNARELRNRTGNLTMDSIMDILIKGKSKRTSYSSKRVVYIKEKYFKETEPEQMWETIEKALDISRRELQVFSTEDLKVLDPKYFSIIAVADYDVTIMSRNTGHIWYIHNPEYPGEGTCIIFHKHKASHPYHQHGRANTLRQAVRSIKGHDKWQMNGRKYTSNKS